MIISVRIILVLVVNDTKHIAQEYFISSQVHSKYTSTKEIIFLRSVHKRGVGEIA